MASSGGSRRRREGVAALPGSIADASIARRRRQARRRRELLVRAGVIALVVALVAGALWAVAFSPLLAAKTVDVQGAALLTPAEVRTRAAVPMRRPLARLDTDALSARVATLPQVKSVEVTRNWPTTVTIAVVERTPVVQVKKGDGYGLADAEGVLFHTLPTARKGLVEVQAPSDKRLLKDLATVTTSLTPQLRKQTTHLEAQSPDSIVVHLSGKRRINWGSAAESQTKSQVATAMLTVKGTVYDVSSPANPTSR